MNQNRFPSGLIAGIIVALFFGVALYLRVAFPYAQVFVGDWIKFTGVDAYYFMRIVDNLVHNFPNLISFDPYFLYPAGSGVTAPSFFVYFIASITWLIGLGSPTQHTVDVVGVYLPAVLGALTIVPVYFIGKALFNRWAGVIAAGLVAIFPGEFLGRSMLGFTDYHVVEVLFTTVAMLFLILGVKAARDNGMTFDSLRHWQWTTMTKALIYSILAGIFLGIYFLTWSGALLFVFIIFVYLVVQFIIDHLRGRSTDYLCFVSTITFVATLLLFLPVSPDRTSLVSLTIAIIIPIALAVFSYLMARRNIKPIIYPAAVLGLGVVSLVIFRIVSPYLFQTMVGSLNIFTWPIGTTVLEMQPLLFPAGNLSPAVAWGNFTTSFYLCFISLGILIYFIIKRGETEKTLFIIWSLVMLAATLAMRRFAYYFVVNVALLVAYLSWLILEFSGFREKSTEPAEALSEAKKQVKLKKRGSSRRAINWVLRGLAILIVFFLVFFPNIGRAINTVSGAPAFAPSDAWYESLTWLKDNTDDPFGNPDFYYELYEPPPPGESYNYPQTAYGVTAWWDYGYWITRIAHRIPNSNPGTGHRGEAFIFTAQDETSANVLLNNWGSRYIIVDDATASAMLKFSALVTLSGNSQDKFYDVYYQPQDGMLKPVLLFYPEYYRSLIIRLYNFDGSQVTPKSSPVISYEKRISRDGQPYKEITGVKTFPTYEAAESYVASQKSGNYRIVNNDPFASPVPLPALEQYKLVHSSKDSKMTPNGDLVPEVKIFEYTK
jgi:dolichyl-diphosphooligosaccharide--protein glycosyltransferase